jgi:hypothetical protein
LPQRTCLSSLSGWPARLCPHRPFGFLSRRAPEPTPMLDRHDELEKDSPVDPRPHARTAPFLLRCPNVNGV